MKKISSALLVLSLLFSITILSGCFGDETSKANAFIGAANKHTAKSNALQKKIDSTAKKADSLASNYSNFKKILSMFKEATRWAKQAKEESSKALSYFKKAQKLDISKEFKKYVGLEIMASLTELELQEKEIKLFERANLFFEKAVAKTISIKEANKLEAEIQELDKESDSLDSKYEQLKQEADNYYKEQELGK